MGKPGKDAPRWLHMLYAFLHSYFWLPCPICGKRFGGHEWETNSELYVSPGLYEGVCRNCKEEAGIRNSELENK